MQSANGLIVLLAGPRALAWLLPDAAVNAAAGHIVESPENTAEQRAGRLRTTPAQAFAGVANIPLVRHWRGRALVGYPPPA